MSYQVVLKKVITFNCRFYTNNHGCSKWTHQMWAKYLVVQLAYWCAWNWKSSKRVWWYRTSGSWVLWEIQQVSYDRCRIKRSNRSRRLQFLKTVTHTSSHQKTFIYATQWERATLFQRPAFLTFSWSPVYFLEKSPFWFSSGSYQWS